MDTVFAFGQRGSYHLETKSKWHYDKLPDKLAKLFTTTDDTQVRSCYSVALGADDSFFISYKGKGGSDRISCDGVPEQLKTWLWQKSYDGGYARNFAKLRVTLGPYNKSFFATDGSASTWLNLPKGLDDAIKSKRSDNGEGPFTDMPRLVALGVNDDYFMLTQKYAASWTLGNYRSLLELINQAKENGLENIANLYLHPYRLQTCIILTNGGHAGAENLPLHAEAHFESIKTAIEADTLAEMKRLEDLEAKKALRLAQNMLASAKMAQLVQQNAQEKALRRQLLQMQQQRQAMEQAMLTRKRQQLNQLNQTINMANAMNIGFMMGNAFGGKLF